MNKTILEIIGILLLLFMLWLIGTGIISSIMNFIIENPFISLIIILLILYAIAYVKQKLNHR